MDEISGGIAPAALALQSVVIQALVVNRHVVEFAEKVRRYGIAWRVLCRWRQEQAATKVAFVDDEIIEAPGGRKELAWWQYVTRFNAEFIELESGRFSACAASPPRPSNLVIHVPAKQQ